MAASSRVLVVVQLVVLVACATLGAGNDAEPLRRRSDGCYARLFSFGDSLTDNGNWLSYARSPGAVARPPYGETFFRRPTGRFCDGRIIIDYIAQALGIPFLTPYLAGSSSGDFAHGANFAVGGATALGHDYFRRKKLDVRFTPYSLRRQVSWLEQLLHTLNSSSEQGRRDLMASSLFLVGEIGGNDYNQALFQGRPVGEVRTYVPDVVASISASVAVLIELGAETVVVPGNLPMGCNPGYLTKFRTNDTSQYDSIGCLRWLNYFTELHNGALREELAALGRRYPSVAVIYADYYAAAMDLTANPSKHGFDGEPLLSCCGGGGPYNADLTVHCGAAASTTCRDPRRAVSWDGFHLTDHAYGVVADAVLRGPPYAVPPIPANCSRSHLP